MTPARRLPPLLMLALLAGCWDTPGESSSAAPPARPDSAQAVASPPDAVPPQEAAANGATARLTALAPATHDAGQRPDRPDSLDLPASDAPSTAPFPEEVTNFMVDRDGCDHFRGEEPYDEERRAYLAESIAELCTGTDARLATLRKRYAADPSVTAALKDYEDRIETPETPRRSAELDGF